MRSALLALLAVLGAVAPASGYNAVQLDRVAAALAVGPGPVDAGDFNSDGVPDLVVGSAAGVSWARGPDWAALEAVDEGAWPSDLVAADLDGDGDVDVATAALAGIRLHLSDGQGGWTAVAAPWNGTATALRVGDLTGDGVADLVFGSTASVEVLKGPDFSAGEGLELLLPGRPPGRLELADLTGDGALDLLVPLPATGELRWYASSTLEEQQAFSFDAAPLFARPGAALDVVVALNDSTVHYLAAGLQDPVALFASPGPAEIRTLLLADLDLSGSLDVLVSTADNATAWYPDLGEELGQALNDTASAALLFVGDLDLDGDCDLVTALGLWTVRTAPPAPANATRAGEVVAWQASAGADGYLVSNGTLTTAVSGTSLTTTGVAGADEVTVAATNVFGTGPSVVARGPPSAPRNLEARAYGTYGTLALVWDAPLHDNGAAITQFVINPGNGFSWTTTADVSGTDVLVWEDGVILQNEPFTVVVAAVNSEGVGLESDSATATPSSPVEAHVFDNIDGTAEGAFSPAAGDIDGDGDLDIAIAARASDSVSWYRNSAAGWTEIMLTTSANFATDLVLADLDEDGDLDIVATAVWDNEVLFFWNQGGGVFEDQPQALFTGIDTYPYGLSLGDIDGDGHSDLACGELLSGNLWVLLGPGPHADLTEAQTMVSGAITVTLFAMPDLDADGDLDIVLPYQQSLSVALYDSSTRQIVFTQHWLSIFTEPHGVSCADMDGSGVPDCVMTDTIGGFLYFFQNIGGALQDPVALLDTGNAEFPQWRPPLVDLDLSGTLDIVVPDFGLDNVRWLSGNGDDTFGDPLVICTADSPIGLLAVDWDGDGDLDLVAAEFSGVRGPAIIYVETVPFPPARVTVALGSGATNVTWGVADDNGDAITAHVVSNGTHEWSTTLADFLEVPTADAGSLRVASQNSRGVGSFSATPDRPLAPTAVEARGTGFSGSLLVSWTAPGDSVGAAVTLYTVTSSSSSSSAQWTTAALSVTIDGLLDDVAYSFSVEAHSLFGVSDESAVSDDAWPFRLVSLPGETQLEPGDTRVDHSVNAADVNQDGLLDLLVTTDTHSVVWYRNPDWTQIEIVDNLANPAVAVLADANSDGTPDVVVAELNDQVTVFPGIADQPGEFAVDAGVTLDGGAISSPKILLVGDITGDDTQDLVISMSLAAELRYVAGPDWTTADMVNLGAVGTKMQMTLGDVDGDGVLDIVVASDSYDAVSWFSAQEVQHTVALSLTEPCEVSAADCDGDGDADVVVTSTPERTVLYIESVAGALQAAVSIAPASDAFPGSVLLADLDLSGTADVLVWFPESGNITWFSGNGDGTFSDEARALRRISPVPYIYVNGLVAADLDEDGDLDVALPYAWYEVETVPLPPATVLAVATAVSGEVAVSWSAGDGNGVSVTAYSVLVDGHPELDTDELSAVITGLDNGVARSFTVSSISYRGAGPASTAAAEAVPYAPVEASSVSVVVGCASAATSTSAALIAWCGSTREVAWDNGTVLAVLDDVVALSAAGDGSVVVAAAGSSVVFLLPEYQAVAVGAEVVAVQVSPTSSSSADVFFVTADDTIGTVNAVDGEAGVAVVATLADCGAGFLAVSAANEFVVPCTASGSVLVYSANGTLLSASDDEFYYSAPRMVAEYEEVGTFIVADHAGVWSGAGEPLFAPAETPAGLWAALADLDLSGNTDLVVGSSVEGLLWLPGFGNGTFGDAQTLSDALPVDGEILVVDGGVAHLDADAEELVLYALSTVPPAPASFVAQPNGANNTVLLSWDAAEGATLYIISSTPIVGDGWTTSALELELADLDSELLYEFSVRGENYQGLGLISTARAQPFSCSDAERNGDESDVDCGGSHCAPCAAAALCSLDSDCANEECDARTGRCAACTDAFQNQDETSVDCGGLVCGPCLFCTPADRAIIVQWDAVPQTDAYRYGLGSALTANTSWLNATFHDLENYKPQAVSVQGAGAAAASCEVTPTPPTQLSATAESTNVEAQAVCDFDGDGDLDVFAEDGVFWEGNGTLTFALSPIDALATARGAVAAGDLDGDGDIDLVVGTSYWLHNASSDAWVEIVDATAAVGAPAVGDTDGDGVLDEYVATASGAVFRNGELVPELSAAVSIALCDVDSDGDLDAVCDGAVFVENVGTAWSPAWGEADADLLSSSDGASSAACFPEAGLLVGDLFYSFVAHPEPPTGLAVVSTPTLSSAVLEWSAPEEDGGVAVTSYALSNGDVVAGATEIELTTEAGVAYEWAAQAVNSIGSSAWSDATTYEPPAVSVAVSRPAAASLLLEFELSFEPVAEIVAPETSSVLVADADECHEYVYNVTFVDATGASATGSSQPTVPSGVCPGACVEDSSVWVDPSREDPFAVVCEDGNWTLLAPDMSGDRLLALSNVSSETRYGGAAVLLDCPFSYCAQADELLAALRSGNTSVAVRANPDTAVLQRPPAATTDRLALFHFESNTPAAVIEVQLDGGAWTALPPSGTLNVTLDDEDAHQLLARSVVGDWLVESTAAVVDWAYDVTAPTVTFSERPALHSASSDAAFGLDADEDNVLFEYCVDALLCGGGNSGSSAESAVDTVLAEEVLNPVASPVAITVEPVSSLSASIDNGEWQIVSSPTMSLELATGWHSLLLRAADESGNTDDSPLGFGLSVGRNPVAPSTVVESASGALLLLDVNSTAAVTLSGGDSFQASDDLGASWADLDGSSLALDTRQLGWFTVLVRAVSSSGLADPTPAALTYQVEEPQPPDTFILEAPPATATPSDDGSSTVLAFNASIPGCEFQVSTDHGASWTATTTTTTTTLDMGVLGEGWYHVLVRAVDPSRGAVDATPAVAVWQVVAAPVASLVLAPAAVSSSSVAVFAVEISGGSDCTVPFTLSAEGEAGPDGVFVADSLAFGPQTVEVRPECDGIATNVLHHEWEVTSAESAVAFAVSGLAEGPHNATAVGTDQAGNAGAEAYYQWVVDLTAPETTLGDAQVLVTTESFFALNVSASEPDCRFNVTIADAWQLLEAPAVVRNVSEGRHDVLVAAVDPAGNADPTPVKFAVAVDTLPPELVVTAVRGWVSQDPLFRVSCDDTSGCVDVLPAEGLYAPPAQDEDGPYSFEASAADALGNVASLLVEFELDTAPPELTALRASSDSQVVSAAAEWALNGTCSDANACWLNVSAPLQGRGQGNFSFSVFAVDEAGNAGDPVPRWVFVDSTPPVLSLSAVTYDATGGVAALDVDCEDATECSVFLLSSGEEQQQQLEVRALEDGPANVTVSARDAAGNAAADALVIEVLFDTVPPVITFVETPAAYTTARTSTVEFQVEDANLVGCDCGEYECYEAEVGDAETTGLVVYSATCVDVRGHATVQNASWVVDVDAPVVSPAGDWAAATNARSWSIEFDVADQSPWTAVCTLRSPVAVTENADCTSPWTATADLEGAYEVNVTVWDVLGHAAASTAQFIFDATAPTIEVSQQPSSSTSQTLVEIQFGCVKPASSDDLCGATVADDDCALSFSLDQQLPLNATATGQLLLEVAAEGSHSVELSATDAAGNVATQTVEWTLVADAVAPTLSAGPAALSGADTASFEWTVLAGFEGVAVVYRLDDGEWAAAPAGAGTNVSVSGLADGPHTFAVAFEGSEGSANTWVWTVDHCAAEGELEFWGDAGALICEACPEQGVRCLNGLAVLQPGYWRSSASSTVRGGDAFYSCPDPEACLGGAACREGHAGVLCALCADGYAFTVGGCQACPASASGSIALLVAVLLVMVALLVVVLKFSKRIVRGAAFKVVLNFVHMVSAVIAFDVPWPDTVVFLVESLGVVNVDITSLTAMGCTGVVTFYTTWLLAIAVPLSIVSGIWLRFRLVPHAKRSGAIRNSLLVLLFLYPGVSGKLIQFFNCAYIEGEWYLKADYSQQCMSATWWGWLGVAAVVTPGFVIGVPVKMLYWLRAHRDSLDEEEAVRSVGLLYRSYRREQYDHEVWVLLYKLSLWSTAVLFAGGVATQTTIALFTSAFMMTIHALKWPYKDRERNVLQLLNYCTVVTLCVGGLVLKLSAEEGASAGETQGVLGVLDVVVILQIVALTAGSLSYTALRRVRGHAQRRREKKASSLHTSDDVELTSVVNPMQSPTANSAFHTGPRRPARSSSMSTATGHFTGTNPSLPSTPRA